MKTYSLIYLLITIHFAYQYKTQRLIFQTSSTNNPQPNVQLQQTQHISSGSPTRNLLTITRNPMRITLDSSTFNTITPGPNGETTTETNLAFVLRAMQVAVNFYSSRLQVYPVTTLKAPGLCVDYFPSMNDQTYGIGASDLHIYVLYISDSTVGYGATGKSCASVGDGQNYTDTTLQLGRPSMGRIIFNTYNLVDRVVYLTNVLFQSVTSTALHETMHILGFDATLYEYWLISDESNPNFGNNYTNPKVPLSVDGNRTTTYVLTTPAVSEWAEDFFSCSDFVGMPLENEDSTDPSLAGSHWERVAMYDQLMTGTAMGTTIKYFSALTFAALKDMGWYTVDDTFNQTSNFGYKKGCSFLTKACWGTSFSEFCEAATQSSISGCQTNFYGKATCTNQAAAMADGCGFMGPYTNCIDPTADLGYASYTFEAAGTNSFCVYSTLGTLALPNTLTSRCYPYKCNPNNITFTIGTYTITCLSNETNVNKTLNSLTGSLTCPNFNDYCKQKRKTCPNWCSQNGYCMGGVCNCLSGYYGNDCSKIGCTSGTYYDPTTSTCVNYCPDKYYQNIYSRSCQPCDSSCDQCYKQPTICTGCASTAANPKYFYNGTCYSTCPPGTFTDGFNCSPCNPSAPIFCNTCNLTANNCTSCTNDTVNNITKFLNQPDWGTCIDKCPVSGNYTLTDVINFGCVKTCTNNLREVNGTCTYCQAGTYKFVKNNSCINPCPNFYYADDVKHLCSECDSSCLTCSGPYAQNCTACSGTLPYWLLSMCWATCPGGYYANNTDNKCYLCPSQLKCGTCTYSSSLQAAICTSCAYNSFFQQSSYSCLTNCNATQYGNKGNNSCMSCDSSCLSCSGAGPSMCTTCSGALLVQNLTGSYCIASCNPIGYTQSGGSCLACDLTCYTCNGTSISDCTSCPNGTFLTKNYCLYVCPPGSFPNSTLNKCLDCDGSCTFCFGPTIDNCTGCIKEMVLYNFTCSLTCPAGYTLNQWNVCFQPHMFTLTILWITLMALLMI